MVISSSAAVSVLLVLLLSTPPSSREAVFCNSETTDEGVRGIFQWNRTPVNSTTSTVCVYGPPDVIVTRFCASRNNLTAPSVENCRTIASTRFDVLENTSITKENLRSVINNLTAIVVATNETVDQNSDSIRVVRDVLTQTAAILQNRSVPVEVVQQAVNDTVTIVDNVEDWPADVVQEQSNEIVQQFENIVEALIQQENFTSITVIAEDVALAGERARRDEFQGRKFSVGGAEGLNVALSGANDTGLAPGQTGSISLPSNIINHLPDGKDISVAFTFYRDADLFPVRGNSTKDEHTVVGSSVLSAQVSGIAAGTELDPPVQLFFVLNNASVPGPNETASRRCAFWDFTAADGHGNWSTSGCTLRSYNSTDNVVVCDCHHLTNFACLVDISARTTGTPPPLPPSFSLVLEITSYVGVVLSLMGLIVLVITYLAFKKLRQKDVTKFHVQLALSLILMLVVFVAGIDETGNKAGCITVGVLLHYLILVAWMWMAAEAFLLFQKLVIVFTNISLKYFITVSVICWGVPVIPVVIPVAVNPDHYITPPNNMTGAPRYCFISHIGVFFGAFLGPIFLVILLNSCIFTIVAVVLVKHTLSRPKQRMSKKNLNFPPKEACKLIFFLSGIMTLLGLTWILSLFTSVGVNTNHDAAFALQWMFIFFNSLQGFFIFIFFVVLSAEARNSWLTLLFPCYMSTRPPTSKSRTHYTSETSSTMKQNIFSSKEHSSMTLEESAPKEKLSHEMGIIRHSVVDEKEEDQDSSPDLATVETAPDEKQSTEVQQEMPQEGLLEDTTKYAEGKVMKARVRRVSTKRKTHHVETAEVDFADKFSDESDDDNINIFP